MKLRDDITSGRPEGHDTVWELLPWYVTDTLPDDEKSMVEAHLMECPECATELGRQMVLAEKVAKTDPFDVPLERSWQTLKAQVEADLAARTPAKSASGWLDMLQGGKTALIGGLAAACVALVVVVQIGSGPEGDFVTLTSESGITAPTIQFQSTDGMTASILAERLAPLGVIAVEGPSEAGVFSATLGDDVDVDAIAAKLMARDDILFAAPEASQ